MKVSIALCTYNGSKFLAEQLESFMQQTTLPDEVVVCDDCSSDNTTEILRKFQRKAPFPVRLYSNEINLGYTKNFEKAISLCTGDIIFLSDQDDVWMPEKIKLIENEFKKDLNVGLVFTDAYLIDENANMLESRLWDYSFPFQVQQEFEKVDRQELLIRKGIVTGATMAFRSKLKKTFLPIPEQSKFIHDRWITLIASLITEILPLEIPLIMYRQHSSQQIGVLPKSITQSSKSSAKVFNLKADRTDDHSRFNSYNNIVKQLIEEKRDVQKVKKKYKEIIENNSALGKITNCKKNSVNVFESKEKKLLKVISHNSCRRDMPSNRMKRLPIILSELVKGNYHHFSRGFRSALLDIVEKIDKYQIE